MKTLGRKLAFKKGEKKYERNHKAGLGFEPAPKERGLARRPLGQTG